MKKIFLLLLLTTNIAVAGFSQVAIAKLKFEDAETAYNAGDYIKAINKLAESEKLFGKINSPILHLRILAQDKLFAQTGQVELGFELKRNCAAFLKDYADVEALEEKYKEVYRINENLADVAGSPEELEGLKVKRNKEYQERKKKYLEVIDHYLTAIGGKSLLTTVQTIEVEQEFMPVGYMVIDGRNFYLQKMNSTARTQDNARFFLERKGKNTLTATYVSTPGTLEWQLGRSKHKGDRFEIEEWNKNLKIFPELLPLAETDSVFVEKIKLERKDVYVLTKKKETSIYKNIYDAQTGLLIYEFFKGQISNTVFYESEIYYKTYKALDGIKFPETYNIKITNITLGNPGQTELFVQQSKQKVVAFAKMDNQLLVALNTPTSLQPNDLRVNIAKQAYEVKVSAVKINPTFREKDLDF